MTTTHTIILLLVALLLLAGSLAFPQTPAPLPARLETRMALKHRRPSEIAARFDVLGGMTASHAARVVFTPEDKSQTLVVRIYPQPESSPVETDRLRLIVEDAVAQYDVPVTMIPIDFYVVRTDLLTDEEFRTLDSALKAGSLGLGAGQTAKGVVFRESLELPDLEPRDFSGSMSELRATTQPEPVPASGKLMASIRPDGSTFVSIDMKVGAGALPKGGDGSPRTVKVVGGSVLPKSGVIIFNGGELRVMQDGNPYLPHRHEVMVYVRSNPENYLDTAHAQAP